MRLSITGPCPRCVMTTLAQADLPKDSGILRTAAQHNGVNVGVYASVAHGGRSFRGDPIWLDWIPDPWQCGSELATRSAGRHAPFKDPFGVEAIGSLPVDAAQTNCRYERRPRRAGVVSKSSGHVAHRVHARCRAGSCAFAPGHG